VVGFRAGEGVVADDRERAAAPGALAAGPAQRGVEVVGAVHEDRARLDPVANPQGAEIEVPAGPIAASERFMAVDTLRGVAVLGRWPRIDRRTARAYEVKAGEYVQVIDVAGRHPGTLFMHCSGHTRAKNVGTYFGRMYEAKYLADSTRYHCPCGLPAATAKALAAPAAARRARSPSSAPDRAVPIF